MTHDELKLRLAELAEASNKACAAVMSLHIKAENALVDATTENSQEAGGVLAEFLAERLARVG